MHKGHDTPFQVTTTKPSTALTSILKAPVVKYPETSKASGRLITTKEFRQQIAEKERKKQEVEEQKILKKAEREKKKQEEADRKALRKAERERKKMEKEMELKMKNQRKGEHACTYSEYTDCTIKGTTSRGRTKAVGRNCKVNMSGKEGEYGKATIRKSITETIADRTDDKSL